MVEFFEIGYCRTGTRSLHLAMKHLGYQCWQSGKGDYAQDIKDKVAIGEFDWDVANTNDLIGAMAAPFYVPLAAQFPKAKFILTTRQTKKWIRSCRLHYGAPGKAAVLMSHPKAFWRMAAFGCTGFNRIQWTARYESHNKAVQELFTEDRLLVLDIEMDGETKWDLLEQFTGRKRAAENPLWPWIRRRDKDESEALTHV